MAPYDSDSDDDENETQLSYTETEVLLGYGEPATGEAASGNETVSRLGGRPNWLVADQAPSAALARCGVCKALMVMLLQLNGELPDRFPGHERRLYVFACRNRGCRRKAGSIRAIRGVRMDAVAAVVEVAAAARKKKEKEEAREAREAKEAKQAAPVTGEALFGVKNPFAAEGGSLGGGGGNPFGGNPFSLGGSSAAGIKNPFSIGSTASATATKGTKEADEAKEANDLPRTFTEALSLSLNNKDSAAAQEPAPVAEPWPAAETWPAAYPVSWIAEAEYETLDPTPTMPVQAVQMEVDDGSSGGSGSGGKEDKYVFESSMDAAFQRFADRVSQNPEQVIRYEFAGQPLLYSRDDTVAGLWQQPGIGGGVGVGVGITTLAAGPPRCAACGARRVFEVQLMPHAIGLLEADELGLEGMDWGTVMVAVCEKDCQGRGGGADKEATYTEEWVGVQWEDLQVKR